MLNWGSLRGSGLSDYELSSWTVLQDSVSLGAWHSCHTPLQPCSSFPIGAQFCTDVLGFALLWCRVSLLWVPFNPAVWHFAGSDSSSRA